MLGCFRSNWKFKIQIHPQNLTSFLTLMSNKCLFKEHSTNARVETYRMGDLFSFVSHKTKYIQSFREIQSQGKLYSNFLRELIVNAN